MYVKVTLYLLIGLAVLYVLFLQIKIYQYSHQEQPDQADYLIILGARVKGEKPSLSLQYRIDAAAEYLLKNEQTIAIASGGQGPDEGISEALAIQRGLVLLGVEEERIYLEDRSTSTYENLQFSKEFIDDSHSKGIVVSNSFHLYRAVLMAEDQDLDVTGLPGKTPRISVVQMHLREYAALTKLYLDLLLK
ncbi:YdcF family protein [Alkalihalobacillus sp. NPDC078783]